MTRPLRLGLFTLLIGAVGIVLVGIALPSPPPPPSRAPRTPGPTARPVPPTLGPPGADRLELLEVASGYEALTGGVPLGDDLMVTEQRGVVHLVGRTAPVLNIADRIQVSAEEGLLGLALHPAYPADRRLFVMYTATGSISTVESYELDPATLTAGGPPVGVLVLQQPHELHNGGRLAFGPDGYLYVSLGDGESPRDPHRHGQNKGTLFAAVLRLDVSKDPYDVPPDNPFAAGGGAPELWVYGLRNPWGMTFDRETGDLWIADVGQQGFEEVNRAPAGIGGLNFGWRAMEGQDCLWATDCDPEGLTLPLYAYPWGPDACAIIGGYVYRGSAIPDLAGRYVFADHCGGRIWSIDPAKPGERRDEIDTGLRITAFAEDADAKLNVFTLDGSIYRVSELTLLDRAMRLEPRAADAEVVDPRPRPHRAGHDARGARK